MWKTHIIRTLNSPQLKVTQVEKWLNFCPIERLQPFDQRKERLGKEVGLLERQGICRRYQSEPKKYVLILGWSDLPFQLLGAQAVVGAPEFFRLHLMFVAPTSRQMSSYLVKRSTGLSPLVHITNIHHFEQISLIQSFLSEAFCWLQRWLRQFHQRQRKAPELPTSAALKGLQEVPPDRHRLCFTFVCIHLSELCFSLVLLFISYGEPNSTYNNVLDCALCWLCLHATE